MKVGFVHNGYPEKRNITTLEAKEVSFVKVFDSFKLADFLYFKTFGKTNLYYHNSFNNNLSFPKADVYHFFNGVNYGEAPWISTFETILPRYNFDNKHTKKAVEVLAKPNCKKIVAISEFNKRLQTNFLNEFYPEFADDILNKLEVIYPPQRTPHDLDQSRFSSTRPLKILFVGHDFFRKGGREVFNAIEMLVEEGFEIELTIISKLNTDNWVSFTNSSDKIKWKEKLTKAKFCNYFEKLANNSILQLMKDAHLLMLPSLQETFGYVILEAQAYGTPVLTTGIRAFPEINNNECGWVIDIPQNAKGMVDLSKGYNQISETIITGLVEAIRSINKEELIKKSEKSLQRINTFHSYDNFSINFLEIYFKAIQ